MVYKKFNLNMKIFKQIGLNIKKKMKISTQIIIIITPLNNNQIVTDVTILKSDKVDFRTRNITRDKEQYFIIIEGSILQGVIMTLNVSTSNNKASKIHEAQINISERKNSQIQNHGWTFQLSW